MKTISLIVITSIISLSAIASTEKPAEFKFVFKASSPKDAFIIKKSAPTKDIAFKLAAKDCYQKLTGGKYPGEERGLDIIDICANPKM